MKPLISQSLLGGDSPSLGGAVSAGAPQNTRLTGVRLREMLCYDPEDGAWAWKISRGGAVAGSAAGSVRPDGYLQIWIDGVPYLGHRLAFLYMTGEFPKRDVDHRDGNKRNGAWGNLREATRSRNSANVGLRRTNTSGFKGVSFYAKGVKWHAQGTLNGTSVHLGYFDSAEDASRAYQAWAIKAFGEFARFA